MNNKELVKVEVEVLNDILEYLSMQKYKDVVNLINRLHLSVRENNNDEVEEEAKNNKK